MGANTCTTCIFSFKGIQIYGWILFSWISLHVHGFYQNVSKEPHKCCLITRFCLTVVLKLYLNNIFTKSHSLLSAVTHLYPAILSPCLDSDPEKKNKTVLTKQNLFCVSNINDLPGFRLKWLGCPKRMDTYTAIFLTSGLRVVYWSLQQ